MFKREKISEYLSQILAGNLEFTIDSIEQLDTDEDKELVYGLVCLSEDLDYYKKNINWELNNFKKTLFNSAGVVITDSSGKIKSCNTNFEQLTGFKCEELQGNTLKMINSNYHEKVFLQKMWKDINEGTPWRGEFRNKGKDGSIFWVSSYIFPIKDLSGSIKEFWSINHDITDKVNAQKALLKKDEELEEAQRLSVIGEFAAGIAHEVNNPLAVIHSKTQLLELQLNQLTSGKADSVEKITDSLESIKQMTLHTSDLIKNLKTFSSKGNFEELDLVKLTDIITMVLNISEKRCSNSGIKIIVKSDENIKLFCSPSGLAQVILNLISNSIDAIEFQEDKWISIESKILNNILKIIVTDSGSGIPLEIAKKITQPFFSTKAPGKGTGLGLSISLKTVEKMKGQLYYNSKSEHTQFVIEFKSFET